jgi:hypothetical protein
MAFEMFELSAEVNLELSPGGCRHDLRWLEPVQVDMASREPVCSMNCPGRVAPPRAECVTWNLGSTGIVFEHIPRIPVHAVLAGNRGVSLFDPSHGLFVGLAINYGVGIEVSGGTRVVGKGRPAVRPQRNQIVAENRLQLVT